MSSYGLYDDDNSLEDSMGIPKYDNIFGEDPEEETEELDFSHDDENL